jgi:hypothetical protein
MPALRILVAGLLLALSAAALAAELVRVLEMRGLPLVQLQAPVDASHELRLTLYSFRGTRWLPADIEAAALTGLPMLAQCGIAVVGMELRILDAPRKYHIYTVPVARELARNIVIARPAIFFVDDTHSEPAYDAEAIGLSNAQSRPEIANTIWFAYGARDLPHALAHELVHVLSDSGDHSDAPDNLMGPETSPEKKRLTTAQCSRLRTVAELNGLLAPRAAAAATPRK